MDNLKTIHKIYYNNAKEMRYINSESVDLVITSPPYPMIGMWDDVFNKQNKSIGLALKRGNGKGAFDLMHKELEEVWKQVYRVLKNGGIACINIGDATRTIDKKFQLFPNQSRITSYFLKLGFDLLPIIIWRKQTNAPNKFMGSGMLPVSAYVTLEHEYILIFRKNNKRQFNEINDKLKRQESSFFWEERNVWFSDVWYDLKGTNQKLNNEKTRKRSGAFPLELAYRLINMYSVKGDLILDPFLGIGTTTLAAIASERNSIGIEIDKNFGNTITSKIGKAVYVLNDFTQQRIEKHIDFVKNKKNGRIKYINKIYKFPVMTKSEEKIILRKIEKINRAERNVYEVYYKD